MDRAAAEDWIRAHVDPVGPIEMAHERPWATVLRVPLAGSVVWFKACGQVQAFEPRLTGQLFARWPQRVAEVLAQDCERGWLLLADAGTPMRAFGNPPELWLRALPLYADRDCAMHIWSHGVAISGPHLRSLSGSAHSHTLSPACDSGMRCRDRRARTSTRTSRSCCVERSLKASARAVAWFRAQRVG
jgi:hypothetical protein